MSLLCLLLLQNPSMRQRYGYTSLFLLVPVVSGGTINRLNLGLGSVLPLPVSRSVSGSCSVDHVYWGLTNSGSIYRLDYIW